MPLLSDARRLASNAGAAHRALPTMREPRFYEVPRAVANRVLANCILPAWVLYVAALGGLGGVTLRCARAVRTKPVKRRVVCSVVVINLLLWPGPGLATKRAIAATLLMAKAVEGRVSRIVRSEEAYLLASIIPGSINGKGLYISTDSAAILASMFLQSGNPPHHETMQDRANAVAHVQISPVKLVGYENEGMVFGAVASDSSKKTIQGVKFSWSSSDANKLQINEAGQAKFLQPGLAKVICKAGTVEVTSPVLIRPGHRPHQTDAEWRADQASFDPNAPGGGGAGDAASVQPSLIDKLARGASSVIDKLAPTASAQTGPYIGSDNPYDELWSDPRNLVGAPPNRAIEPTRIGPVLPESNSYQLALPLSQLAGRGGVGLDVKLYFNSKTSFSHGNTLAFDPIASWLTPGFNFPFERIVPYGPSAALKYILIDRDGTRRFLGTGGTQDQTVTLRTTDGSNITYVGNASWSGTLYYQDGTKTSIGQVSNRLVATQITDKNGNFIAINYNSVTCGDPNCELGYCYCPIYPPPMSIGWITDSLGRVIQFNYDSDQKLVSITGPGVNVRFDYAGGNWIKRIVYGSTGKGVVFNYSSFSVATSVSFRRQMIDYWGNISDGLESATFRSTISNPRRPA